MALEEKYVVLAEDQRVFGSGIKRKRVQFVPAVSSGVSQTPLPPNPKLNAGDRYLSIVLPKEAKTKDEAASILNIQAGTVQAASETTALSNAGVCDICNLPLSSDSTSSFAISNPHETSLVHQVCLAHSHPPSHLDRTRPGLKYLAAHGWDPDSRLGLGAKGEGIRAPLKGKPKNDTVGLGVKQAKKMGHSVEAKTVQRLDAKGVRKNELEDRKRREKLQEMFYGNGELEKYLGTDS